MTFLSDAAVARLRAAADTPDLSTTRYRLIDKLGEGGMGAVYRVEDPVLGREIALKMINFVESDALLAERLLREARIIAQLEHAGIVPVHDSGRLPDGRVFYTMKLVQGKRLDEHVRGLPALSERLRIFQMICEPVAFAHARGVLHRDLKPENVMIGPFGEVLVMDWGVSKFLVSPIHPRDSSSPGIAKSELENPAELATEAQSNLAGEETLGFHTAHGAVTGTPGYMAPEQARGEHVDQRADVYSLGAILKFLMPADGGNQENAGNMPLGMRNRRILNAIVSMATATEPSERYPSVRDLMADVAYYVDGLPVSAYPEGVLSRAWRWIVRNRVWILLVLAYLIMRTLLIVFRQH